MLGTEPRPLSMLGKHPMTELPLSIFPGTGSCKHLYRSTHLRQGKHGAFSSLIREPGPPTSLHNTTNTNSISEWPQHSTRHSPLSSQDSDWKELRDCTSDRLSRALYGWEGFSSRGFLERQGSRSTTLAERKAGQVSSEF